MFYLCYTDFCFQYDTAFLIQNTQHLGLQMPGPQGNSYIYTALYVLHLSFPFF